MNVVMRRILGCSLTILATVLLVGFLGHLLDTSSSEPCINAVEAFEKIEKNSLDVIIYGSSHAWKGCDTRVMCDEYDLNAYNYGCNWQSINTTLLFLQNSYYFQTPKVAFVEVGLVEQYSKDTVPNGQIYYTRYMKNTKEKREFLKICFGNDLECYAAYYVPLFIFHDWWNQMKAENFEFGDYRTFIETRGYVPSDKITPLESVSYDSFEQYPLPEESRDTLDKMVELCKSHGTELVFFVAPCALDYSYDDAMQEYAESKGVTYFNFHKNYEMINLDWQTDLQDAGHLNDYGAGKIARFLASYVQDNGIVD